jgi:hypothetical protein
VVGEAVAQNGSAELKVSGLEVKAGDTLDFIADCRANSNSDSFNWAPKLKFTDVMKRSKQAPPGGFEVEWDAKADFTKPRPEAPKQLAAWEKLAHALLVSNEAAFVD